MKSEQIIQAWDQVTPDAATQDRLWRQIVVRAELVATGLPQEVSQPGLRSGSSVSEHRSGPGLRSGPPRLFGRGRTEESPPRLFGRGRTGHQRRWLWALIPAGAAILVIALIIPLTREVNVPLTNSHGVSVTYTRVPSVTGMSADLVPLTEAELLAGADIFTGQVERIDGIRVEFSDWQDIMSLLTIHVTSVVRGELAAGDEVTILVSTAIGLNCSICQLSQQVGTGSTALFIARTTDENAWAASLDNSEVFYYSDVARYYLGDPIRYLFLETQEGVVFSTYGWPNLAAQSQPIDNDTSLATSLTQVEDFIRATIA